MEAGEGLRRLLPLLEQLPDSVTVFLHPTMGFFGKAECVVAGPGTVLVIATLHWKGIMTKGENSEWRGLGNVDLGRPDKRAAWFADRLYNGGYTEGLHLEPVVIATAGPVELGGVDCIATMVPWDSAAAFLQQVFAPGGAEPERVLALLGGR